MIKIVLLGAGNVASHLAKAFLASNAVELIQIYNRSKKNLKQFESQINTTTNLNALAKADIYIIAIPDDEISSFSVKLDTQDALVAHTSGSVAMLALAKKHRSAVFYPLQTFTKGKDIDFKNIPICIEAENKKDLTILEKLATTISDKVYKINSKQRKNLHVAAVFVNNFTNHLYHIGHQICNENNVPFEILAPLIQETANKIQELTPFEAQTGPAKRDDTQTIATHLAMLNKEQQEIYKLITQSITKTYGKKL